MCAIGNDHPTFSNSSRSKKLGTRECNFDLREGACFFSFFFFFLSPGDRRFENMTVNQSNGSFFQVPLGNTDPRCEVREIENRTPLDYRILIIDDPTRENRSMIERAIGFNSLLSRNFVVFAVRLSRE